MIIEFIKFVFFQVFLIPWTLILSSFSQIQNSVISLGDQVLRDQELRQALILFPNIQNTRKNNVNDIVWNVTSLFVCAVYQLRNTCVICVKCVHACKVTKRFGRTRNFNWCQLQCTNILHLNKKAELYANSQKLITAIAKHGELLHSE